MGRAQPAARQAGKGLEDAEPGSGGGGPGRAPPLAGSHRLPPHVRGVVCPGSSLPSLSPSLLPLAAVPSPAAGARARAERRQARAAAAERARRRTGGRSRGRRGERRGEPPR